MKVPVPRYMVSVLLAVTLWGCGPTVAEQLRADLAYHNARSAAYNERVRAWQRDVQDVASAYHALQAHPAFARVEAQLARVQAQAVASGTTGRSALAQALQRYVEQEGNFPLEEQEVARALVGLEARAVVLFRERDTLDDRRANLEAERAQLEAAMTAEERRRAESDALLQALGTALILQSLSPPPPPRPTNCTTTFLGGVAHTRCW